LEIGGWGLVVGVNKPCQELLLTWISCRDRTLFCPNSKHG